MFRYVDNIVKSTDTFKIKQFKSVGIDDNQLKRLFGL